MTIQSTEEASGLGRMSWESRTKEQRQGHIEMLRLARKRWWLSLTPEQRAKRLSKAGKAIDPKAASERAIKAWKTKRVLNLAKSRRKKKRATKKAKPAKPG